MTRLSQFRGPLLALLLTLALGVVGYILIEHWSFLLGSVIVALRHDHKLSPSPPDAYQLQPGDELILIGSPERLRQIERLS